MEVCEEWYYVIHYLKSVVNNIEESLNDLGISSSVDEGDGLKWYARPYHYTADDIVDIKRLQSPDKSIYPAFRETYDHMPHRYCEKSNVAVDDSTSGIPAPHISSACGSLDRFLASSALAVSDLVQRQCDCVISNDLLRHGGPAELLPYLDTKTLSSGLITGLELSHNSYVLHCENVSRQLMWDSFGLLRLENSRDTRVLSAGTSSDLTPGGNGDEQELPNIDQLRAIQDNLAYNVCSIICFLCFHLAQCGWMLYVFSLLMFPSLHASKTLVTLYLEEYLDRLSLVKPTALMHFISGGWFRLWRYGMK